MEVATKTNEIGGYLITSWREEPEIYGGVGEPSHPPQVGHHPEPCAQHHHLLEEGWRPSTNSSTPGREVEEQRSPPQGYKFLQAWRCPHPEGNLFAQRKC